MADSKPPAYDEDSLVVSDDPHHPANHICTLCRNFYNFGWVTGTGGGVSIKHGDHVYIAPSGVQKELMKPTDMFVMDYKSGEYLRRPEVGETTTTTDTCPLYLLLDVSLHAAIIYGT